MSLRTERIRQALSGTWGRFLTEPLHPGRLVAGSLVLGVILGIAGTQLTGFPNAIVGYPYIIAGGELVNRGITEFSGKVPTPGLLPRHRTIIASIVIVYIVAPWLVYQGLRLRKKFLETGAPRAILVFAVTILGGACLFNGPLGSLVFAPISFRTWRVMSHDQEVSMKRDELTSSAALMGAHARLFRAVPGAGWSRPWQGGAHPLRADDLTAAIPARQGELFPLSVPWRQKFLLEHRGADSLTLCAVAGPAGVDLDGMDTAAVLPPDVVRVIAGIGPSASRVVEVR
jgi:hypothetical protein